MLRSTIFATLLAACIFTTPLSAKKYRVVTFDGGGMRGAVTAQILKMLDDELDFIKNIDLFAGTASGSLLATGLASKIKPEQIVNFYLEHGKDVFQEAHKFDLFGIKATYSEDELKKLLLNEVYPSNPSLWDLNTYVLVTAFQLHDEDTGSWYPIFFSNFSRSSEGSYDKSIDVILRSCACPTEFPSYQGYISGNIAVNNPAMAAICAAIDPNRGNRSLDDVVLFSIGASPDKEYIKTSKDMDWGIAEWVVYNPHSSENSPSHPLLEMLYAGSMQVADMQAEQLLGTTRYRRILPEFNELYGALDYEHEHLLVEEVKKWPETRPDYWNSLRNFIITNFVD